MDIKDLIDKAAAAAGSRARLEAKCGVKRNTIYRALQKGVIDAELALRIERATNGALPAYELCPELPWPHKPQEPATQSLTHNTDPCQSP